jgi:hypothetical protein
VKHLIQWRAIIAGLLVCLGGSNIIGDIMTKIIFASAPPHSNKTTFALSLFHNNKMLIFMIILGSLFAFLGGFAAASFSKRNPLMQAAIVGILCLIYSIILKEINLSGWFETLSIIIPIPLSIMGGYTVVLSKKYSDS